MEHKKSRVKRNENKKREQQQTGVAPLRTLADLSRIVEFGEKVWHYLGNLFL